MEASLLVLQDTVYSLLGLIAGMGVLLLALVAMLWNNQREVVSRPRGKKTPRQVSEAAWKITGPGFSDAEVTFRNKHVGHELILREKTGDEQVRTRIRCLDCNTKFEDVTNS